MKPHALLRSVGLCLALPTAGLAVETVAQWTFDEPLWLYPSHVIDATAGLDAPLVLGMGGQLVEGRFGHALSTRPHPAIDLPTEGEETAALGEFPIPPGRTVEPLTWRNNHFAALMTGGERHLRKQVSFVNPSATGLNLGAFDWTVEFWYRSGRNDSVDTAGVVFELGRGPRAENEEVTRLLVDAGRGNFVWENQPAGLRRTLAAATLADGAWHHYAFVHDGARAELQWFVDGRPQGRTAFPIVALPVGDEAYLSLGRDGRWGRPLAGALDELRFSKGSVYAAAFAPPASLAPPPPEFALQSGPPPLFGPDDTSKDLVNLGGRKYVFIDDALLDGAEGLTFTANPPRHVQRVIDGSPRWFRKHLTVIEDEEGIIRIYNGGPDDYLMVHISADGEHFTAPDTGIHHQGRHNIVIPEAAPLGRPIIDVNGPPETRWKYVSGLEGRGVYLYTSPDGYTWTRWRQAVLPFRSGSQSSFFYDEQRGYYAGYHRTGLPLDDMGGTRREFVLSQTDQLFTPWPLEPLSQAELLKIARERPLRSPLPWWLDNGPLTPGDFGIEMPTVFAPDPAIDPPASGVYNPKATKYPWAPDTYVAFPAMYFDYEQPLLPAVRQTLFAEQRGLGSGVVVTQLAVSRDGVQWHRFPRPVYTGLGVRDGRDLHQIYMGEGLVRRGDEIWQYFYGQEDYHSPVGERNLAGNGVYRVRQRLDGFVSADAPYDRAIEVETRPLRFAGKHLELNIDAGGLGFAQVGLVDAATGEFLPGYGLEDCVYINVNSVAHRVEWLGMGGDVSAFAGKDVRLRLRLRGTKLYALQFVEE